MESERSVDPHQTSSRVGDDLGRSGRVFHLASLRRGKTECGLWYDVDYDPEDDGFVGWVMDLGGMVRWDDTGELVNHRDCCEDCSQAVSERAWERQMRDYYGG